MLETSVHTATQVESLNDPFRADGSKRPTCRPVPNRPLGGRLHDTGPFAHDPKLMTVTTKIHFAHPKMALAHTILTVDDAEIRILPDVATDPDNNVYFIVVDGGDRRAFEDKIDDDHTVEDWKAISIWEEQCVYGITFTDDTKLLAPKVTEAGGICLEARCGSDGWIERWQLPSREALTAIWEFAREREFSFEILELYRMQDGTVAGGFGLTEEQRVTLVLAYEQGYFREPREVSLDELADRLNISPAAVSGRLRRGLTTLVGSTLVDQHP